MKDFVKGFTDPFVLEMIGSTTLVGLYVVAILAVTWCLHKAWEWMNNQGKG